jgi:hypothetical protein
MQKGHGPRRASKGTAFAERPRREVLTILVARKMLLALCCRAEGRTTAMIARLIQVLGAVLLALLAAACAAVPAPPAGRAEAARTASPNAVSSATNCDTVLARNKVVDEAARTEFARARERGEVRCGSELPPVWAGACAQTPGGAWAVVLDEVHYTCVHEVMWHIIHLDAAGHAVAGQPQNCNHVKLSLEPKGDELTVRQTCNGPEEDFDQDSAYRWTGTEVRGVVPPVKPPS